MHIYIYIARKPPSPSGFASKLLPLSFAPRKSNEILNVAIRTIIENNAAGFVSCAKLGAEIAVSSGSMLPPIVGEFEVTWLYLVLRNCGYMIGCFFSRGEEN